MQANPNGIKQQMSCIKMLLLQIIQVIRKSIENSKTSDRINPIRKTVLQQNQEIERKKKVKKMQQHNLIEDQNRYIIDVRRVHQEVSNGPNTNCKYCGLYDSKYHCGFAADLLLPDIYLELSNKGFFRAGKYFWKQNPYLSCCKEYAIRMNVQQFKINSQQSRTYTKFAQKMHQNFQVLDQKEGQESINHKNENIKDVNESGNLDQIEKTSKKDSENDENKQIIQKLLCSLSTKIFNQEKGFKNSPEQQFKIFKTKGRTDESDYYSNILQVVSVGNKDVAPKIEQLIEKYEKEIFSILEKECELFTYSIHPQQKFLLFRVKKDVEKPQKQITQMNKSPSKSQIKNGELNHSEIQQNQQKQKKQKNDKQPKQESTKKVKQTYVNEDGSLIFDEFSSRYIRIGDLEISLEDNQYQEDVYQIHCDYFQHVHQRDSQSSEKFANDKCIQIIEQEILQSKIDPSQKLYTGTFFFKYRLKGELIAVSHVDILPKMFMSQYFFYKPELKQSLKLGINSALIEIEYVKRMQQYFPEFLYFNFVQFIPRTTKMNYKADFQKQEILCPETCKWVDLTLEMKKQLYENPADNPRLAPKEWAISSDHDFSDFDIECFLYNNFMMFINGRYLMIQDLIPESQPQILLNLACILQAMGKTIFNSLTFGY